MARTMGTIPLYALTPEEIFAIMDNVLVPLGYTRQMYDAEVIWGKYDGVLVMKQCFSVLVYPNQVLLQAWMKDALIGETELNGFAGALPKSKMKKYMNIISNTIQTNDLQKYNSQRGV